MLNIREIQLSMQRVRGVSYKMEKEIRNIGTENRTGNIGNIYANTGNTNINAKSAGGPKYAPITG